MAKTIPFFIGGHEVAGKGRTAPVFNPATGEQTASVSLASTAEVNEAIAVAKKAFPAWASTPPLRRARPNLAYPRCNAPRQTWLRSPASVTLPASATGGASLAQLMPPPSLRAHFAACTHSLRARGV